MKRPNVHINARADTATVRLGVDRPRLPRVDVELDPSATRELIRELEEALVVALGQAVTNVNDAGQAVAWREAVGFSLEAFAPTGTIR